MDMRLLMMIFASLYGYTELHACNIQHICLMVLCCCVCVLKYLLSYCFIMLTVVHVVVSVGHLHLCMWTWLCVCIAYVMSSFVCSVCSMSIHCCISFLPKLTLILLLILCMSVLRNKDFINICFTFQTTQHHEYCIFIYSLWHVLEWLLWLSPSSTVVS